MIEQGHMINVVKRFIDYLLTHYLWVSEVDSTILESGHVSWWKQIK